MKHLYSTAISGLAFTMAAVLTAGEAEAVDKARWFRANPTSYCQAALPVFDGNIRKRPLALTNEGANNAFVTCSFTSQDSPLYLVTMRVSGTVGLYGEINCTGVTGSELEPNQFVTKTFTFTFFEPNTELVWGGGDFGGGGFLPPIPGNGLFSVSCNLLPGMSIRESEILFIEDVGA